MLLASLSAPSAPAGCHTLRPATSRLGCAPRLGGRPAVVAAASAASAQATTHVGGAVDWAVEVTRHTLTLPQVRRTAAPA